MIQEKYIRIWKPTAPWELDKYVEQDLIICRAVIAIFSDEFLRNELAWRGGTALHKLYLKPQARYSEDIDLVQINPGPIKPIVERLDAALSWLPNKSFDLRRFGFRQRFRFDSEIPPVEPMRLKIETNTYEHFSVLGYAHLPFAVDNPWFSGSCNVTTFRLDELLATKFRALYQRKKLRDLFDMDYAIRHADIAPDEILACWQKYMALKNGDIPSQEEIIANLEAKLTDPDYLNDMQGILRPGTEFDPRSAYNRIRETFFALPSWAGIAAPHIHLHANGPHSMSYIRTILSKKRNSERRE